MKKRLKKKALLIANQTLLFFSIVFFILPASKTHLLRNDLKMSDIAHTSGKEAVNKINNRKGTVGLHEDITK